MTSKKKLVLIGTLVLIMAISAIAGTAAWLNDSDSLTNTFLVGAFTPPTDPVPTPDPDDPNDPDDSQLKGYIHEPLWDKNSSGDTGSGTPDNKTVDKHRLVPGQATVKDPYVGIGVESEAGYVYVYIENKLNDDVYFKLNENWAPVGDKATVVTVEGDTTNTYYSGGLFMYVNNSTEKKLMALNPQDAATGKVTANHKDIWTLTPVFSAVNTANKNGVIKTLQDTDKVMVVHAFIHQQIDTSKAEGEQDSNVAKDVTDNSKTVVEKAAIDWADKIKNPTT